MEDEPVPVFDHDEVTHRNSLLAIGHAKRLNAQGWRLKKMMDRQIGYQPPGEISRNLMSRADYFNQAVGMLSTFAEEGWRQQAAILILLLDLDREPQWDKFSGKSAVFLLSVRQELLERMTLSYTSLPTAIVLHILTFCLPKGIKPWDDKEKESELLNRLIKGRRIESLHQTQALESKDSKTSIIGNQFQLHHLRDGLAQMQQYCEAKKQPMTQLISNRSEEVILKNYSEKIKLFTTIVDEGMKPYPVIYFLNDLPSPEQLARRRFEGAVILTPGKKAWVISPGEVKEIFFSPGQSPTRDFLPLLSRFAPNDEITLNEQMTSEELSNLHQLVMKPMSIGKRWDKDQNKAIEITMESNLLKAALIQMLAWRYRYHSLSEINQSELIALVQKQLSICQWGLHPLEWQEDKSGNEIEVPMPKNRSRVLLFVTERSADYRPTGHVVFPLGEEQSTLLERFIFQDRGLNQSLKFKSFIEGAAGKYIFGLDQFEQKEAAPLSFAEVFPVSTFNTSSGRMDPKTSSSSFSPK